MFFRAIYPQSLLRHFELARCVPEAEEGENPNEDSDGVRLDTLQGADIDCLRAVQVSILVSRIRLSDELIPQPVPKVHPLDHHRSPFMTLDEGNGLERIFNVAMAKVVAFDCGYGGDICELLA
jgi:hypothetical protein